jgi:hypothetical protein
LSFPFFIGFDKWVADYFLVATARIAITKAIPIRAITSWTIRLDADKITINAKPGATKRHIICNTSRITLPPSVVIPLNSGGVC